MSNPREFIDKYIAGFINQSREQHKSEESIPPTPQEIEQLMIFLQNKELDPIIVGSVAINKHLQASFNKPKPNSFQNVKELDLVIKNNSLNEIQAFRTTVDIDFFISKTIPNFLPGWQRDKNSIGVLSWISPSGGIVDFLIAGQRFPNNSSTPLTLGKDPESVKMGCPIADLKSLFLMKLNSDRDKDFLDLLVLARTLGIPNDLNKQSLNSNQREQLSTLQLYLANE